MPEARLRVIPAAAREGDCLGITGQEMDSSLLPRVALQRRPPSAYSVAARPHQRLRRSTEMTTAARKLGQAGPEVSAIGLGCWAIGGPFLFEGKPDGWGAVDDAESIRAINRAVDLGVTFFDTADAYGTGRSERVLGQALRSRRDEVIIATKFG